MRTWSRLGRSRCGDLSGPSSCFMWYWRVKKYSIKFSYIWRNLETNDVGGSWWLCDGVPKINHVKKEKTIDKQRTRLSCSTYLKLFKGMITMSVDLVLSSFNSLIVNFSIFSQNLSIFMFQPLSLGSHVDI